MSENSKRKPAFRLHLDTRELSFSFLYRCMATPRPALCGTLSSIHPRPKKCILFRYSRSSPPPPLQPRARLRKQIELNVHSPSIRDVRPKSTKWEPNNTSTRTADRSAGEGSTTLERLLIEFCKIRRRWMSPVAAATQHAQPEKVSEWREYRPLIRTTKSPSYRQKVVFSAVSGKINATQGPTHASRVREPSAGWCIGG